MRPAVPVLASSSPISPSTSLHLHHPTHLSLTRPKSRRNKCVWTSQWWLPLPHDPTSSISGKSNPRSTFSATPNQSTSFRWATRQRLLLHSTSSPRPHKPRPPSPPQTMKYQRAASAPTVSRSWRSPLRESWNILTRSGRERGSGGLESLEPAWGQWRKEFWWAWRESLRWNKCCSW